MPPGPVVDDPLAAGLAAHRDEYHPDEVVAMEPASRDGLELLQRLGVRLVRSNQFLCHPDEFAAWAGGRRQLKMEDFYRWQRRRLGYLMDGDEPVTGRWNYDSDNRESPPKDGRNHWPAPLVTPLDDVDRVQGFIARGELRKPSREERRAWPEEPGRTWTAVVVQPFVLVQDAAVLEEIALRVDG